ncbi:MAG TPA: ATP-dependent DNA ligase, partial [Actinomycetota bacterium]|nr:ATP-dependent DNA ligase [Actinomycetota bacterium]
LYDGDAKLRSVGVVSSFTDAMRRSLLEELWPLRTELTGHPWELGYGLDASPIGRLSGSAGRWTPDLEHDWVPLRPERVCEVAVTQIDRDRLRFPAQWRRWRPDRDPRSCSLEQLQAAQDGDARDAAVG